jgi:transcriptional regulator with XRE-family HTH domain
METFGSFFNKLRLKKGLSLRQFCLENHLDASNISKLERDVLPPPKGEALERYGAALGLKPGDDDFYTFHDLAATANRMMPSYLTDEEIEEKVPVFFRALRSDVDKEELVKRIKEIVKKAWRP